VEEALSGGRLPTLSSPKVQSKRIRGV